MTQLMVDVEEPQVIGTAHWSVFLPTLVVATVSLAVWASLEMVGRGDAAVARFAFLTGAVATPLLALVSFLRYQTTRVIRTFDGFWIETGWPSMTPRHVGFGEVDDVAVRQRPPVGRFDAGTLELSLRSGDQILVRGLARVRRVAAAVSAETPARCVTA